MSMAMLYGAGGGGKKPTLFQPSLSIDYQTSIMTITDGNGDFPHYQIYAKTTGTYSYVGSSDSKIVDLTELFPSRNQTIYIQVVAVAAYFVSSPWSSEVVWEYGTGTAGLAYTLSNDGTYYICSGIGTVDTDNITNIEIGSVHYDSSQSPDTLPVVEVGQSAFQGNTKITSVKIPLSVTTLNNNAFNQCSALTSVDIGQNVRHFGNFAFSETKITSIIIPEGTTRIARLCYRCQQLTSVKLPSTLTNLGLESFRFATALPELIVPATVTEIEYAAADYTSSLKKLVLQNVTPPHSGTRPFTSANANLIIYVPYAINPATGNRSIEDYKVTTNLTEYAAIMNPLVNNVAELMNIDTTAYTKACVVGNEEYTEYEYINGQWGHQ